MAEDGVCGPIGSQKVGELKRGALLPRGRRPRRAGLVLPVCLRFAGLWKSHEPVLVDDGKQALARGLDDLGIRLGLPHLDQPKVRSPGRVGVRIGFEPQLPDRLVERHDTIISKADGSRNGLDAADELPAVTNA